MSILDKLKGMFSSDSEPSYFGYYSEDPKDAEKNMKLLSDNNTVLARLKNLNQQLMSKEMGRSNDLAIAERLIKEGGGS